MFREGLSTKDADAGLILQGVWNQAFSMRVRMWKLKATQPSEGLKLPVTLSLLSLASVFPHNLRALVTPAIGMMSADLSE
jgi:hypothetical protein